MNEVNIGSLVAPNEKRIPIWAKEWYFIRFGEDLPDNSSGLVLDIDDNRKIAKVIWSFGEVAWTGLKYISILR